MSVFLVYLLADRGPDLFAVFPRLDLARAPGDPAPVPRLGANLAALRRKRESGNVDGHQT